MRRERREQVVMGDAEAQEIYCPTCQKLFVADMKSPAMPFCSPRCKWIDLNRWLTEDIGLPHARDPDEEAERAEDQSQIRREWIFEEDEEESR
jgi:endogenous inhibitor of DNA gyrase (YacG/DUF329 family)